MPRLWHWVGQAVAFVARQTQPHQHRELALGENPPAPKVPRRGSLAASDTDRSVRLVQLQLGCIFERSRLERSARDYGNFHILQIGRNRPQQLRPKLKLLWYFPRFFAIDDALFEAMFPYVPHVVSPLGPTKLSPTKLSPTKLSPKGAKLRHVRTDLDFHAQ